MMQGANDDVAIIHLMIRRHKPHHKKKRCPINEDEDAGMERQIGDDCCGLARRGLDADTAR